MDSVLFKNACSQCFELDDITLSNAFYYNSIALCVIDAVFSIGVRYSSTVNTVKSFCLSQELRMYNDPETYDSYSLADLICAIENIGSERAASELFHNHQRTSTRNGILKSEAVLRFAAALTKNGINTFSDYHRNGLSHDAEADILTIPGQRSGASTAYFKMLAGSENDCKPDRHVLRFIEHCMGEKVDVQAARTLMQKTVHELKQEHPSLTVRKLDHAIWKYMSSYNSLQ